MRNILLIVSLIMFTSIGYGQADSPAKILCNASVGDHVWNDFDEDGLQDIGEPGIEGVLITLYRVREGDVPFNHGQKITDENGHYQFLSVAEGHYYYLTFQYPSHLIMCPCDMGGDPRYDSNLRESGTPFMGISDTFTLEAYEYNSTIDGGFFEPVLPLEIMDFDVNIRGNANQVNWSIANVFNEEYVALEKAYGDEPYTEIMRYENLIEGNYSYTDYSNSRIAEVEFYRLAIINYDGEVVYSQVIKAETGRNADESLDIYPNPTRGMVAVDLNMDDAKITALTITDLTGKLISRQPFNNNSITFNIKERVSLNGMYILGVELSNGQIMYRRILISF